MLRWYFFFQLLLINVYNTANNLASHAKHNIYNRFQFSVEIIYNNHEKHFWPLCAHSSPLGKSIFLLHFLICQIATHITSQPVRWFYFPFSVLSNFHRELRWVNSKALAYLLHTAIDSSPGTASKVPALPHRSHTVVHRRCCVIFIMFFTVLVRQWNVIYRSLYLAVIP